MSAPTLTQFRLPDVGEGLAEAEIVAWHVAPGDTVTVNQPLVDIETAKAVVQLPSPYSATVVRLLAQVGDTVPVGAPIVAFEVAGAPAPDALQQPESGDRQAVLVGYGTRADDSPRRRRRVGHGTGAPDAGTPGAIAAEAVAPGAAVLAKPPVRKLAKTLGIDLAALRGSGPGGIVTRADVQAARGGGPGPQGDERIRVHGIQKAMATAMVESAFTAPHVSAFVTVDVTATMQVRETIAARPEFADVKVTPLLFVARAVTMALRRHPQLNATWQDNPDGSADIIRRHDVNLGIAVATPRGLVVPTIPAAQGLSLRDLAGALADLTESARAGRTTPAQLSGGTFSITNVGAFGIDAGTPILYPGQAGILAMGAITRQPWVMTVDGQEQILPRWVMTLVLSFDHRIADGEQGSRLLGDVAAILHDPGLALL